MLIDPNVLIANDVSERMGRTNERENRPEISITADSLEETKRLFKGLSEGGDVEVPNDDNSESFFAMFREKYGIEWIVNFENQEN